LTVASPSQGATVHDTTRVTFTGTNLRAVQIRLDDAPQGPVSNTYVHPTQFDGDSFVAADSLRDVWIEVALEWHADHACWYADGLKFRCTNYTWVSGDGPQDTNPATVLLNYAVGGPWAGSGGVEAGKLAANTYDVDHVRVYQK
jgi:beta-glucanase (GH16 family)